MPFIADPLIVQHDLRTGTTLAELQEDYHLLVKRHPLYPNLVMLKYHQFDSPLGDPLVQQCRGLILDEADNWAVVARPFDKFFNHGEGHAAIIDWATARVQEKLDGSLCILYYYAGAWHVATSGTPDASGVVNGHDFTFKELFWKVFAEKGYHLPDEVDSCMTFMFELTTPFNRVVVKHDSNDLKLIGLRNHVTGREVPAEYGTMCGFQVVQEFPLQKFCDLITSFEEMDPLQQEGYVVVDANFNRIKVKHPGYVALHHMKGEGVNSRRLI